MTTFSDILTRLGGEIEEGARTRSHLIRTPIGSTFIVCDPDRAVKQNDLWVVKAISTDIVTAENLVAHNTVSVPLESLQHGLRRFSGVGTVDLTK